MVISMGYIFKKYHISSSKMHDVNYIIEKLLSLNHILSFSIKLGLKQNIQRRLGTMLSTFKKYGLLFIANEIEAIVNVLNTMELSLLYAYLSRHVLYFTSIFFNNSR